MVSFAYTIAIIYLFLDRTGNIEPDIEGIYGFSVITSVILVVSAIIMGIQSDNEKRDRYFLRLPVTLKQISRVRLMSLILFQSGMVFLWGVVFFLGHLGHDNQAIWYMSAINAILLILMNFIFQFHDLGFGQLKKYRIMYVTILFIFIMSGVVLIDKGYLKPEHISFGNKTQKTFLDAFIYNSICVGMFYLSHHFFLHRKSYQS